MATITRNHKKDGIEVAFDTKPHSSILDWLKIRKYRWSRPNEVWWKKYSESEWDEVNRYFSQIPPEAVRKTRPSEWITPHTTRHEISQKLIDKHGNLTEEKINMQFALGIEIEKEHTQNNTNSWEELKIAFDHLWEDPEYYTRPKPANWAEKEIKKEKEMAESPVIPKGIEKDILYLLGLQKSKHEGKGTGGANIDLFKASLFGKLKTLHKNREQSKVDAILTYLETTNKALKIPMVYTPKHKIWTLRRKEEPIQQSVGFFRETAIITTPGEKLAEEERKRKAELRDSKVGSIRPDFMDSIIKGREIQVIMPNGEKRNAIFAIVELDMLIASHNEENFHSEPEYPKNAAGNNINDRNYKDDVSAQKAVMDYARDLEPERLITTSRTPSGTPIVTKDGFVVSGNNRTMSLKLAARQYPLKLKDYADLLIAEIDAFGFGDYKISSFEVGGTVKGYNFRDVKNSEDLPIIITHPILIRIDLDFPEYTTQELAKYNKDTKKSERPVDKAIKLSNILRENSRCAEIIAETVGDFETFSEFYLSVSAQKRLAKTLVECNLLTTQELPAFFTDTTFTEAGKEFIENLLAALVLDREALQAAEQPGVKGTRQKLLTSLPVLMKNASLPEGSLKQNINDAVILQYNLKGSTFPDFIRQSTLFGTKYDRKTTYLNRLIDVGKIVFKKAIEGYNAAVMQNQLNSLFGEKPSLDQIFDHYIKSAVDQTDQRLIENSEIVEKGQPNINENQPAKIIFPDPGHTIIAEKIARESGQVLDIEQAQSVIESWKGYVKKIAKEEDHTKEIILSIYDRTGKWSEPYKKAGYIVVTFDISNGDDMFINSPVSIIESIEEDYPGAKIIGILSAPPCTSFSVSGAWAWNTHDTDNSTKVIDLYGYQAARMTDKPVEAASMLVQIIPVIIETARDKGHPVDFYVLENPVGRIAEIADLPKATMTFQPNVYGDPYTKKTMLWGEFNTNLPQAYTEATEGSKITEKYGSKDRAKRSITPEGFAYSFFMANNTSKIEYMPNEIKPRVNELTDEQNIYFTENNAPDNIKDRFGISKTQDRAVIENIPKIFDSKLPDGEEVWIVDGKYIRDNIYSDFSQGGNDMAYPEFVPIGELWVEKDLLAEREPILTHEKRERDLMVNAGYKQGVNETEAKTYDEAHEIVKNMEDHERGIKANQPEEKYVILKENYITLHKDSIGKVVSKPNMFVSVIDFGTNQTGQRLISKVDNTYFTYLKEKPILVTEGKSSHYVLSQTKPIITAQKGIEIQPKYKIGDTVTAFWDKKHISVSSTKDEIHKIERTGTIQKITWQPERQKYLYNVVHATGFFLAEEEDLRPYKTEKADPKEVDTENEATSAKTYSVEELQKMYSYEKGFNLGYVEVDDFGSGTFTRYHPVSKMRGTYPKFEQESKHNGIILDEYKWYKEVSQGRYQEAENPYQKSKNKAQDSTLLKKGDLVKIKEQYRDKGDNFTYLISTISDLRAEIEPIDSKLNIRPINVVNINQIEKAELDTKFSVGESVINEDGKKVKIIEINAKNENDVRYLIEYPNGKTFLQWGELMRKIGTGEADTEKTLKNLMLLRKFISVSQHNALSEMMVGEENQAALEIIEKLAGLIEKMPHTYQTEEEKADEHIVYLHYFRGGSDWYVIEKDKEPVQYQAFGYAILNGDTINAEWGYINIVELIQNNVELDFYFEPIKFGELLNKWQAKEEQRETRKAREIFGYDFEFDPGNKEGIELMNELKILGIEPILKGDSPNVVNLKYKEFEYLIFDNSGEFKMDNVTKGEGTISVIYFSENDILAPISQLAKEIKEEIEKDYARYQNRPESKQKLNDYESQFNKKFKIGELVKMVDTKDEPTMAFFNKAKVLRYLNYSNKEKTWIVDIEMFQDLAKTAVNENNLLPYVEEYYLPNNKILSLKLSDYKNAFDVNKAIEALLDQKWNSGPDAFSAEEKEFINLYTGYGGLDDEAREAGQKLDVKSLFEFYTPDKIIEKMWGLAYKYGYKEGPMLEPSVSVGRFLKREYVKSSVIKAGYEINKYSAKICKILYPETNVNDGADSKYFEQIFLKNNYTVRDKISPSYTLVIGNPPYGKIGGTYMGMGEGTYSHAKNYIDYFIFRGLDLLLPDGLLIYIVGAEVAVGGKPWLDQGPSKCKEMIVKKGKLIDAYRLPEGIFERTKVVSDILVFRKK
jgi:hypothetical protein